MEVKSLKREAAFLPKIQPVCDSADGRLYNVFFKEVVYYILNEILSDSISKSSIGNLQELSGLRSYLHTFLPLVSSRRCQSVPGEMSFFFLSRYRANSFKFFFEIISNWLVPGKRLNVSLIYAVDFLMPEISDDVYTLCEIKIQVDSQAEIEKIDANLPILETELRLGIDSERYARRILEIKGLSTDAKTALIQQDIAYLLGRMPRVFDHDLLTEMQHVLVMCPEAFKAARQCRHLSRLISLQYLFRKFLQDVIRRAPRKRHISLKVFRARLSEDPRVRNILSIVVGVNFIREKEIFDQVHLLKALQNCMPSVLIVENSFFAIRRGVEAVSTLYIEVEQKDGRCFSNDEIQALRQKLPADLKDRVEYMMHPVFMPRNEEEVFRNILSLSNQIKYVRDIPQVFISFDEQTATHLYFTIILVRILKSDEAMSICEMFKNSDTFLHYIEDRCQFAGNLRRKHKKEATVFRVMFPKEQFLRVDHSIDLNRARQAVVLELCRILGDFRDFNGGMISKQNELLSEVKKRLDDKIKYNEHLLENFFYSLSPVIMRTVLEPEAVCTLFLMLLESSEQGLVNGQGSCVNFKQEEQFVFAMIKLDDAMTKETISRSIALLRLHSSELATSYISLYDVVYLGYIYHTEDKVKKENFCDAIFRSLDCLNLTC